MTAKIDDRQLRELLIKRYAAIDRDATRHLLRCHLKQTGWLAAVKGALLFKRMLDLLVSSLLLLVLMPLMALIALALWLESPGPVLQLQTRIGRWGKPFALWTFRTAIKDRTEQQSEPDDARTVAGQNTRRPTRIGQLILQLGFDALPQLVNVLKGDLSLTGPRPPFPHEVDQYSLADRCRLEIQPGIWQTGGTAEVRFDRQVEIDVRYSQSTSLWTDLKLLGMLTALILSGGGYSATVSANATDPTAGSFRYDNSQWTTVDIALANTDGNPILLSFYSEGPNGLRLLENAFTDAQGYYSGEMRLPAHLEQVVVVVRSGERQDTLTLPITDSAIAYTE